MTKEDKMVFAIDHAREALKNDEMPIAACIFLEGGILVDESKRLFLDYIKTLDRDSYLYKFSSLILENN